MKNFVRIAVAGALLAGGQAVYAQAVPTPSSDASDLWLFVSDQGNGTTFAEDTGITVASLLPTGSLVTGATLSTAITDSLNLAASSALSAYIAANGASNLEWAVEGINIPGTPTGTGFKKAGGIVGITDNTSAPVNTSQLLLSNLQGWGGGFQQDVTYLNGTYTTGGSTYAFSNGSTAGNVWGAATGNAAGSTNLYGQGQDAAGVGLGSSAVLFGLTGNGGTGQAQSYILSSQLELTANGTLETVNNAGGGTAVPLPPAVWLLGSALLGLAGVGRRRGNAA
jgi:hypothetical protein